MNLNFVCTCGHTFPSELNRWSEFNAASGEEWREKCTACGATWNLRATAEVVARRQRTKTQTRKCQCGKTMLPTSYSNSGTTYISAACPVLVEEWGPDTYVWRHAVPPHQFEIRTTPEHAQTGCCDVRYLRVHP